MRRLLLILLLANSTGFAQQVPGDSLRAQRLAALGRLWGVVKYFHPAFLSRDVPWDSALIAAVPRVRVARDASEYRAAVDEMLSVLQDRATHVRWPQTVSRATEPIAFNPRLASRWEPDSTLVIAIPCCFQENARELEAAARLVERAQRVVFDFRGPRPAIRGEANDEFGAEFGVDMDARLVSGAVAKATERRRVHLTVRDYGTDGTLATYDVRGGVFRGRPGQPPRRVIFLAYADSDLPEVAWALQNAGYGSIVLDDTRGGRLTNTSLFAADLGEGLLADVRIGEAVGLASGITSPDTVVARSPGGDAPLAVALALARRPGVRIAEAPSRSGTYVPTADDPYTGMRFPSLPYRLLAAYRYWNAIHYFYPSPMPDSTTWDDVLVESVHAMEAARDSTEYQTAVAKMVAHLRDGHAQAPWAVASATGEAGPRVTLKFVEGEVVVTAAGADSVTIASGIKVGDVIRAVDGEPVAARMARIAAVAPGTSRPDEPNGPPVNRLLYGSRGSTARVTVERAEGGQRELQIARVASACTFRNCPERSGPAIRFLSPDVGYADLASVPESMVDSLFETFRNTQAIIFDGRGPNAGAPAAIAARLSQRPVVAGQAVRPIVTTPDPAARTVTTSTFTLDSTTKWRYRGKTVLLINERAFSNQEQVAVFFTSANGTTLIGSPTAGGIGGLTFVRVPGGLAPTFPSTEGRLADGRVMHRIGVQPDILVRPTIAGIRAGRDEVLERAIAFLREALRQ